MSASELYAPASTKVTSKPNGTTMEGMIWNANHVLDMAVSPHSKKSKDILKDAVAVVIVDSVEAGFVLTGSRGSGVLMVKNGDHWSAPSAILFTGTKIGLKFHFDHLGLMIVFVAEGPMIERTLELIDGGLTSVYGISFSRPKEDVAAGENPDAATAYVATDFKEHCFVYTYTDPPHYVDKPLDGASIKYYFLANRRFYGKNASPEDITKGRVAIPEGSGIPDLQSKLKALEHGTDVTPTPEAIKAKEVLRQKAVEAHEIAKSEHPDEIEECSA
jgi:lipid-binding SYLF domain-containing protein